MNEPKAKGGAACGTTVAKPNRNQENQENQQRPDAMQRCSGDTHEWVESWRGGGAGGERVCTSVVLLTII